MLHVPALALLAVSAVPGPTLERQIGDALAGVRAEFGVAARHVGTGESAYVNGDTAFPTASAIKVAVMVEALHQAAEGRFAREAEVVLREEDKVGGSGVLQHFRAPRALTGDDLLHLMMAVSDNTATNMLVDRLGAARIDARLESRGITRAKVFRGTFRDGRPEVHPGLEKEFGFGMATPRDMARLLELIATGRIVDAATSRHAFELMERQAMPSPLPRFLPLAGGRVRVAHKPGWDSEKKADARGVKRHVRSDVGIVETPKGTYVVALFARGIEDTRWTPDNEAVLALARASRAVYDHFTR